ncbi:MAG: cytochrome b/b6 domain-containing protein [bacterium]|jgi:cytochrome b subunit of formate dehydrogenase|nr:cytochrome b/b6 domain-containing protein [bacterium]
MPSVKHILFLLGLLLGLGVISGYTQDVTKTKSCMECHEDQELTGEIDGEEVSVFFDLERYEKGIHADLSCVDCHDDIAELPHDSDLKKVDCSSCHDDVIEEIKTSVHGAEGKEGPSCADCHSHPHHALRPDDPESTINHQNILAVCSKCHNEENPNTEAFAVEHFTAESYAQTVHGKAFQAGNADAAFCTDCHGHHKILPSSNPESPLHPTKVDSTCAQCHQEVFEIYKNSIHGKTTASGSEDAATCTSCHGEHDIVPVDDPDSPLQHNRVSFMCGKCHFDLTLMDQYGLASAEQETLFKGSVHAEEVAKGNEKAPNCVSCHGSHNTLPLRDPDSPSNFMHVPETCGQCHEVEKEQYLKSVHGVSAMRGHKDSPVCTDCHGEHAILRPSDDQSPVSVLKVAQNTCARCHASIVINDKYGISSGKVENYFDSYHGLALQHGSKKVANCSSCHGYHLILHSSDPNSTVSKERLVETCGSCHPGISSNVLAAPIHADVTIRSQTITAWVPRIYILLIVVIIGGMLLHNGVIFWAGLRKKYAHEKGRPSYRRFTRFEIWMHVLLTISFILLVITGFALLSPNSWWVTMLSYLQFNEAVRGLIHRVCGVILIVTSILYAGYMVFTKRGRSEFIAFFPVWKDAVDVVHYLSYHMGWRAEPPKFDRYDYMEKMEFWALVWGVIIMAITGLILWFPIQAFEYLPKWAIDMAELIHYYEAVLATLAIAVWHIFLVIFHPDEYPMSLTWLTGEMTEEHLKKNHPLEYERLKQEKEQAATVKEDGSPTKSDAGLNTEDKKDE